MLALESGIEPDRWLAMGDRVLRTGLALLAGGDEDGDEAGRERAYPHDMPPLSG